MTTEGMKSLAEEIRTEVAPSHNTAEKIGSLFRAILDIPDHLSAQLSTEMLARESGDAALEARLQELSNNVITSGEMDAVLGGSPAVYLTDAEGHAVLDDEGRPIEIIE